MADLKRDFGARVRRARLSRGFTQSHLAGEIGKSVEMVSRIERGLVGPSFETISQIGKVLNVTAGELFGAAVDSSHTSFQALDRINVLLQRLSESELKKVERVVRATLDLS